MAYFTETLIEYVKDGGTFPASFDLIEGFEDLFFHHFCDKEIGFETEELFAFKLEGRANLVMQVYADRIAKLKDTFDRLDEPVKTYYEERDTKLNMGAQKIKTSELPFEEQTATPSVINQNDAYENNDNTKTTRTESGDTTAEVIQALNVLNGKVRIILSELLDEFNSLFMGVY